jgi:hypothetical protein
LGRNVVQKEVRTENVLYSLRDQSSPFVLYEGLTDIFGGDPALPIWQIKRTITLGDFREVTYAQFGKFNCTWDFRTTYFPPPPPPPTDPLPAPEVDIYPGEGTFFYFFGASTPGVEQTVVDCTVPADKWRYLHRLVVDCRLESQFKIEVDGAVVGSGRTGPARPQGGMVWTPGRIVYPGSRILAKITLRPSPVAPEIGVWLQSSDL